MVGWEGYEAPLKIVEAPKEVIAEPIPLKVEAPINLEPLPYKFEAAPIQIETPIKIEPAPIQYTKVELPVVAVTAAPIAIPEPKPEPKVQVEYHGFTGNAGGYSEVKSEPKVEVEYHGFTGNVGGYSEVHSEPKVEVEYHGFTGNPDDDSAYTNHDEGTGYNEIKGSVANAGWFEVSNGGYVLAAPTIKQDVVVPIRTYEQYLKPYPYTNGFGKGGWSGYK